MAALTEDLAKTGKLKDTVIVWMGEFGRTPKINAQGGRDHWPQVSCAVLAGGGLKTGRFVGSTDRLGEAARERPVTFPELTATLYHALGLNPATTAIIDPTGRPQHLSDGVPLPELV
jgi:uncharacterized protein (DUF1501 family)